MPRVPTSLAVYFGARPRRAAASGRLRYRPVAVGLRRMIIWSFTTAVLATTFLIAVGATPNPSGTIVGGAIGGAIFATIDFFGNIRRRIPHDDVPAPPADANIDDEAPSPALLLLSLGVIVALAWVTALWDLGPFLVPGQFLGYTTSNAAGLILVRGWERRHGRNLLVHHARAGASTLAAGARTAG